MIRKFFITIIFLSFSINTFASVDGDLGNFFSSLGFDGNVSSGNAYTSQAAGYYSAGSAFLRNRVRTLQIFHLDAPTIRSGCGGIDIFLGGFSFINAEALTKFFQKIMSQAAGYALDLALETEVPEIAHAMQYIQQIAQKINDANINSCEMAEDLVGGLWPKTRASQQQVCQDIGSQNNIFSDWAEARQGCSTGTDFSKEIDAASKDEKYKQRVVLNKNLIWEAILQNGFLSGDTKLAEFFMSISGTVIYDKDGNATVLYPLINNRDIVKALLYGGDAQVYICDEDKQCLGPHLGSITISNNGLNQQVKKMLTNLVTAVQNDNGITDQQKGFLNSISIPVLKFITVSLSLGSGSQALDIMNYSDVIAKDLLKQYLLEAVQIVEQSVTTSGNYNPDVKKQLEDEIQKALIAIENIKTDSHEDLQDAMTLVQHVKTLEMQTTSLMSDRFKENLNFNGGGV